MILTEEQRGTAAFDLEKARAVDIDILAATDWGELRARYRAALAEIERLRADAEQYEISIEARLDVIDQQAARIKELEDALVEERANKMIQTDDCTQNQEAADIHHRCICEYNVKKCPVGQWWLDRARQALQAEGKIGPDADECPDDLPPIGSPYRSWQITEERKAAIQWASEMAGDCKAGDILRTMLTEGER